MSWSKQKTDLSRLAQKLEWFTEMYATYNYIRLGLIKSLTTYQGHFFPFSPRQQSLLLPPLARFLDRTSWSRPGSPHSPVSQLSSRGKQEELASSSSSSSPPSIAPSSPFLPAGLPLSAARRFECGESQPLAGAGSSLRGGPTGRREQKHTLHTFQLLSARTSCSLSQDDK